MRYLKKIGDFLFGKDPDIFDKDGKVLHRLPEKLWDSWANKYKNGPEFNWRNHSGRQSKQNQTPQR